MKTKYIVKGIIATLLLTFIFANSACESYTEELLDGIGNTREFSPIGLTAKVRNQTTVELAWTTNEAADHYVVEFSADDPDFKVIYKTVNVTAAQVPVSVALEGETTYAIRVKAVTTGLADSKWSVTSATTLSEQLFSAVQPADIGSKQVTLRWVPNSNVTQITLAPGGITRAITAAEKTAGVATITGLTPETAYTATLLNGAKKRGTATFTTAIDIGNGILVKNTDDLLQKITDAAAGAVLVLEPGDYSAANQTGAITLNKSITIRGLRNYDPLPQLHVNFVLATGATNVSLIDLDLKGDKGAAGAAVSVIKYNDNSVTYGALLISGCKVHDYGVSLISANLTAAKIPSIIVENSILTNILTNGGEFIDVRGSHVGQLTLKNSTFNNCSTARAFIRLDAGLTGLTANILIDACTISNPNMLNTAAFSLLYARFVTNVITVRKTLFANTPAPYTREAVTANPTFTGNNYFNSPNLIGNPIPLANNRPDTAGTALDPQFVDAATGNFKVRNQTLIDNQVGDPRWRQ